MILAVCSLFFSCKKDPVYTYFSESELEMVVALEGNSIDTLQSNFGASYTLDLTIEGDQLAYAFYRDGLKIRSLTAYERDYTYSIIRGDLSQDVYSAYAYYDTLSYVVFEENQVVLYKEYFCVLNYPFNGVNCFKEKN
jgi:hypothetical protein